MDIARTPDTSLLKRYWPVFAALGAGLGVYLFVILTGSADFRVDRDTLLFATVKRGDLLVKVRGAGFLVPQEVRWIASSVEGRVERVLVKPGAEVDAGEGRVGNRCAGSESGDASSRIRIQDRSHRLQVGRRTISKGHHFQAGIGAIGNEKRAAEGALGNRKATAREIAREPGRTKKRAGSTAEEDAEDPAAG
jgi:hypothetical protein